MVQLIIFALSGICLLIGVWRYVSPPGHLEEPELLAKHKKEAIKLIVVSVVAGAIGAAISFV